MLFMTPLPALSRKHAAKARDVVMKAFHRYIQLGQHEEGSALVKNRVQNC